MMVLGIFQAISLTDKSALEGLDTTGGYAGSKQPKTYWSHGIFGMVEIICSNFILQICIQTNTFVFDNTSEAVMKQDPSPSGFCGRNRHLEAEKYHF